ncbi:MAG: 4Fe-4S binding protein [Clostridiales bacterium]|nr:4Fe-4S binding protein [Clostridiales bacterium]
MNIQHLWAVYFSPTGGTKRIVEALAGYLGDYLGLSFKGIDFTLPAAREKMYHFGVNDLVVLGSPVYAGRLPNKIMPDYRRCFSAEGTPAIPVAVYGNRSYGGALAELHMILEQAGFRVAGEAAVVSRHAFSDALAAGRPDKDDLKEIREFAENTAGKLQSGFGFIPLGPVSEEDIPPYYTPRKEDGTPARFLKAKPETDFERCDHCGICAGVCPMGSIDENMQCTGVCIKCQACIRKCPKHAKYFTDEDFLSHVRMLERDYTARAENHLL